MEKGGVEGDRDNHKKKHSPYERAVRQRTKHPHLYNHQSLCTKGFKRKATEKKSEDQASQ